MRKLHRKGVGYAGYIKPLVRALHIVFLFYYIVG